MKLSGFIAFCALFAVPVLAAPGGKLGTLPLGRYVCTLPGDAAGDASVPVEDAWFETVTASSYESAGGHGIYLRTGDTVVFTGGAMRGARFEVDSSRTVKRTDLTGEMADMRCTRLVD